MMVAHVGSSSGLLQTRQMSWNICRDVGYEKGMWIEERVVGGQVPAACEGFYTRTVRVRGVERG
jgi:hypothetical protein